MSHFIILSETDYQCARAAAVAAGKTQLVSLLDEIWDKGNDLQRKPHPPFQPQTEAEEALTDAQSFFVSVCGGNTNNREAQAQSILDAIENLL